MAGPAISKGGLLREVEKPEFKIMQIKNKTFERLKWNSERFGDRETFDEILIRLLDFYEQRK